MAERDDTHLEAALRDLGRSLDVPLAPDVSRAVRSRLASPRTSRRTTWFPRVAVAVMVALLAVAVTVTISPGARAAFVELLRFAGVEIRQEPPPGSRPAAPSPQETRLLPEGRSVTLTEARRQAPFPIYVPSALGRPDAVRVSNGTPSRVVSLLYRPGPGLPEPGAGEVAVRLDEFLAHSEPLFQKFASAEEDVDLVDVGRHPGMWVAGPHRVRYLGPDGIGRTESPRPAANTLIWQVGGVTLRLEGKFGKAEALDIARSVTTPTPPTNVSDEPSRQ